MGLWLIDESSDPCTLYSPSLLDLFNYWVSSFHSSPQSAGSSSGIRLSPECWDIGHAFHYEALLHIISHQYIEFSRGLPYFYHSVLNKIPDYYELYLLILWSRSQPEFLVCLEDLVTETAGSIAVGLQFRYETLSIL